MTVLQKKALQLVDKQMVKTAGQSNAYLLWQEVYNVLWYDAHQSISHGHDCIRKTHLDIGREVFEISLLELLKVGQQVGSFHVKNIGAEDEIIFLFWLDQSRIQHIQWIQGRRIIEGWRVGRLGLGRLGLGLGLGWGWGWIGEVLDHRSPPRTASTTGSVWRP